MTAEAGSLSELLHREVVLDTRGAFLYIGTLAAADEWFYTLEDADVHDGAEGGSTKEVYIMEAAKFGVKKNRRTVLVRNSEVISLSLLDDVIKY